MSECVHDLSEMETALAFDGLCPLCLREEIASLRARLAAAERERDEALKPTGVCDECGGALLPRDATWFHPACRDKHIDALVADELAALIAKVEALLVVQLHSEKDWSDITDYIERDAVFALLKGETR